MGQVAKHRVRCYKIRGLSQSKTNIVSCSINNREHSFVKEKNLISVEKIYLGSCSNYINDA